MIAGSRSSTDPIVPAGRGCQASRSTSDPGLEAVPTRRTRLGAWMMPRLLPEQNTMTCRYI